MWGGGVWHKASVSDCLPLAAVWGGWGGAPAPLLRYFYRTRKGFNPRRYYHQRANPEARAKYLWSNGLQWHPQQQGQHALTECFLC